MNIDKDIAMSGLSDSNMGCFATGNYWSSSKHYNADNITKTVLLIIIYSCYHRTRFTAQVNKKDI